MYITGWSSILTAINIIASVHKMRCPGMTWSSRLPLFVWAMYATSLIQIARRRRCWLITIVMLAVGSDCSASASSTPTLEGDPILFQHMFWFYSHPAVYIMIRAGDGRHQSETMLTCFSRKNIFGYKADGVVVASASRSIGFLVWGHHMFVSGQGYYLSDGVLGLLTMLVAVPSAIKVFNWCEHACTAGRSRSRPR